MNELNHLEPIKNCLVINEIELVGRKCFFFVYKNLFNGLVRPGEQYPLFFLMILIELNHPELIKNCFVINEMTFVGKKMFSFSPRKRS